MTDLKQIEIDGKVIEVDGAMTILQAAEVAGIEIPRFCYHERLSIAGNCRMCLVEVVGGPPKPAASCAMQVRDLRPGRNGEPPVVKTNSPMVKKAREGVMEFLLINHPLDCPICDQGGECDLQDQAMAYGVDFSRYREPKRAANDMDLGPLVGTCMTRCISCTRCVRFITEVAGCSELGQTGRGEDSEITNYLGATLSSELQGNLIDLCPVGALTSKPYAFTARPWELKKTESVDVIDALGANIRVDVRGREVMRLMPRNHDGVNEEWLADRSRFIWDGLRRQRLDKPYIRKDGKLVAATWAEAFEAIAAAANGKKVNAIIGDLAPAEAIFALKTLVSELGGVVEARTDGAALPLERSAYAGTAAIEDIDGAAEVLIIGGNLREESPVLNARVRKAWSNGANVSLIGAGVDLTYPVAHLGTGPSAISGAELGEGAVIILAASTLAREDGAAVLAATQALAEAKGAKILVLHTAASRVGALDLGAAVEGGIAAALDAEVIWNLGADEIDVPAGPFVIYQGSHGDRGAHRADVILPGAAWTEEPGLFVNTEGRPQLANRAGFPPGQAKENWAIIRAASASLGKTLPFDSLQALRAAMFDAAPVLAQIDAVPEQELVVQPSGALSDAAFAVPSVDHYLVNPICRASTVMAELSRLKHERGLSVAAE
ncbi:NADH-quinone oxidoreductase subunit NuoG [Rhodovulum sp. DZ06]|uniref:NADH-quinone oxidoreductase subunit NuoG n=1 Tax=Rhodovulum sp. DZ06 TaxID=3425126 RepID=UPI003D3590A8